MRGCVGYIVSNKPLYETIVEAAIPVATRDPRFHRLNLSEMPTLAIEISVLTPFQPLKRIEDLEIGVHGLYIKHGVHSGLLLPQVATTHNWNRTQFLQQACKKSKAPGGRMARLRDKGVSVQFASCWRDTLTFPFKGQDQPTPSSHPYGKVSSLWNFTPKAVLLVLITLVDAFSTCVELWGFPKLISIIGNGSASNFCVVFPFEDVRKFCIAVRLLTLT